MQIFKIKIAGRVYKVRATDQQAAEKLIQIMYFNN